MIFNKSFINKADKKKIDTIFKPLVELRLYLKGAISRLNSLSKEDRDDETKVYEAVFSKEFTRLMEYSDSILKEYFEELSFGNDYGVFRSLILLDANYFNNWGQWNSFVKSSIYYSVENGVVVKKNKLYKSLLGYVKDTLEYIDGVLGGYNEV